MSSENDETILSHMKIPVDDDDPRFCKSFVVDDEQDLATAKAFFDTYGFVIFRGILTQEECTEQFQDMIALMQEKSRDNTVAIDPNSPDTWKASLTHFGVPKVAKKAAANGIMRAPLLRLRQHAKVCKAFEIVMDTPDIIVSHDRWLIHRPPPSPQHPLSKRNVHLDLNPAQFFDDNALPEIKQSLTELQYTNDDRSWIAENNAVHVSFGPLVQGIVNIQSDITNSKNGGTIIIPGFHKVFEKWIHTNSDDQSRIVGPRMYKLPPTDPLQDFVQHPTLRQGSMILWDQRLFHGSTPNMSQKTRIGIPIKAFKADVLKNDKRRVEERKAAIERAVEETGFEGELTPLGRKVFGLDL